MKSLLFGLFAFGGWLVVACASPAIACWMLGLEIGFPVPPSPPELLLWLGIACLLPILWLGAIVIWAQRGQ